MPLLGVNIDHVATLRQARRTDEPDPAWAACEAQLGGADLITVHLREDRRHIQDHDVHRVAAVCQVPLNLEMAATPAMIELALALQPAMCTLVPEGRLEITTEGGLDVAGARGSLTEGVSRLADAGIRVSAFIDAVPTQVHAAAKAGFHVCELHTGPYAACVAAARGAAHAATVQAELARLAEAGRAITEAGMVFNAGHALTYRNVQAVATLPGLQELHIGHSIISRAVFIGLRAAVAAMKEALG